MATKRIILSLLCMILLVGTVSAFTDFGIDNFVRSTDEKTIEVWDQGLFLIGEDTKLTTVHLDTDLVQTVGYGQPQKVFQMTYEDHVNYTDLISEFEFYNVRDDLKPVEVELNLKYQKWVYSNESYLAEPNIFNKLEKPTWIENFVWRENGWSDTITKDTIKDGTITVSGWVTPKKNDLIEWIPTIAKEKITQWAVYNASGGTKTTDGDYTVHTFTSDGIFNITSGDGNGVNVTVLVVAGGGGGGNNAGGLGGGGGAGGVIYNTSYFVAEGGAGITVTVGEGGAGGTSGYGGNGTNSSFGTLKALGGGSGGIYNDLKGSAGGSGGGGGQEAGSGGAGYSGQGNNGGDAINPNSAGAGGGGCGAVGSDSSADHNGGNGGIGCYYTINGSNTSYAGGGGGGAWGVGTVGSGGAGGGGVGGHNNANTPAGNGTDGLGGGGGGGNIVDPAGNGGDGVVIVRYLTSESPTDPTVTLNSPVNYYNSTNSNVTFNCSMTDPQSNGINLSLIIDHAYIHTVYNTTTNENLTLYWSYNISEGNHNWTCDSFDADENSDTATQRNFTIDLTSPTVNDAYNLTNLTVSSLSTVSNWSYNVTDPHLDACYYSTSDNATNTTSTCNDTILTNWTTSGVKVIDYCANDTFGFETCKQKEITIMNYSYTTSESIDPVGEGGSVVYDLTLNLEGTPIETAEAFFIFNSTIYSPTTTTGSNQYRFNYNLTIADGWGNSTGIRYDWNWTFNFGDLLSNTSTTKDNTTVYNVSIDDCSGYTDAILNLTLNDEATNTLINVSEEATNLELDLILSKGSNSWQYSNTWVNDTEVSVCVPSGVLNNTNYTIDFIISFYSDDRVNEFFYLDKGNLSAGSNRINSLTNKTITLMDLATADSTSFLFNYFDEDGLTVDDIIIHVFRNYVGEGTYREVERSKQNDDGDTVVHLVEEDVIYYFVVSQNSTVLFTSNEYTALCQDTPCEIQLEESGGFQSFDTADWDLIENGSYLIESYDATRIVNMTYSLTTPSTMNITVYSLSEEGEYSPIGSNSSTGTSGSLLLSVPSISGNTTFFASVYQDGIFRRSQWVDFEEDAGLYFGNTLSLFLGALIILTLGLMAVTEGSGTIIFLFIGMFIAMVLGLVDYRTSTGGNVLIYLVVAGGLILWKLTRRNR